MLDWSAAKARLEKVQNGLDGPEYATRILDQRARQLAVGVTDSDGLDPETMLLVFRIGAERYGVFLREVAEVISNVKPCWVPGAPPLVAGMIQVRGDIVPVYHLRGLLGAGGEASSEINVVLILRVKTRMLGIVIDEVEDMRHRTQDHLSRSAVGTEGMAVGMTADLIMVLDTKLLVNQLVEKEG